MGENLLDHHRVFDAGDDLYGATAAFAGFDVDVEHPLQALRPSHGGPAFRGCGVLRHIRRAGLVALAAFSRRHLCMVCAAGTATNSTFCVEHYC